MEIWPAYAKFISILYIKYEQIDDRDFCLENLKEKINWRTVENPV